MKKTTMLLTMLLIAAVTFAKDIKTVVVTTMPQMHCESCETKIKGNLRFEKGIKSVETNIDDQAVTIQYDADKTNEEAIMKAFGKFGYQASKKEAAQKECEKKECDGKHECSEKKECDKNADCDKKACGEKKECCGKCQKAEGEAKADCCKDKKECGKHECAEKKECNGKQECAGKCEKKCEGADKKCEGKCEKH
jgi:copper chaperone CopZ